jgi:large subunit ribosomal protein L22
MAAVETPQRQTVRAQAKWVHSSARKARLVTDLIRGRSVPEARTVLAFSKRAVAKDVEKVLRSAVANAESRPDLLWNGDDLVVAVAYADEGPTLKRWRARARGRVARINKRTCHITIELAQSPAARAAAAAAEAAAPKRRARRKAEPEEAVETEATTAEETAAAAAPAAEATDEAPADEPTESQPTEETEES